MNSMVLKDVELTASVSRTDHIGDVRRATSAGVGFVTVSVRDRDLNTPLAFFPNPVHCGAKSWEQSEGLADAIANARLFMCAGNMLAAIEAALVAFEAMGMTDMPEAEALVRVMQQAKGEIE